MPLQATPQGVTPSVVLVNPKYAHNVGAALRACSCFDLKQLWWTHGRVTVDPVKGERLPREERMKGYKDVAMCPHDRPLNFFASTAVPVAVEVRPNSECLTVFEHPDEAVYVFGPEAVIPRFGKRCEGVMSWAVWVSELTFANSLGASSAHD